jgi:hypothetical protein
VSCQREITNRAETIGGYETMNWFGFDVTAREYEALEIVRHYESTYAKLARGRRDGTDSAS